MNSIGLVDPELRPLLDLWPTILITNQNLAAVRAYAAPIAEVDSEGVSVRSELVPGPAGAPDVRLLIYKPETTTPLPAILHLHGGGFVAGAPESVAPIHFALARQLGCSIISVDYRLAPETRFPGTIEDCYAALAWTVANANAEGIDVDRLGVIGESAGGGLAAALALMARDRGDFSLAFQLLVYPMLDDRTGTIGEPHPTAGEFIWPPENNRFGWAALLGHPPGGSDVSPYAAPARADDLAGLPPTFISTGALDLFAEEDMEYARRLSRAGVAVELHVYPGAFHAFDLVPDAAVAIQARRDCAEALGRFLHRHHRPEPTHKIR